MSDDLICRPFVRTDGIYTLQDAICLTQAEWDTITDAEVTAIEDQRWQVFRDNLNAPVEPPPEDAPADPPAQE